MRAAILRINPFTVENFKVRHERLAKVPLHQIEDEESRESAHKARRIGPAGDLDYL
jgi:hypothetical protein